MTLRKFHIMPRRNTVRGMKVHVYKEPRYEVSFELTEKEMRSLVKQAQAGWVSWRGQDIGRKLLDTLAAYGSPIMERDKPINPVTDQETQHEPDTP